MSKADAVVVDLKERAALVRGDMDRFDRAKARKAKAEDDLLREVVRAVKPALPAICTKVDGPGLAGPIKRALRLDSIGRLYLGEEGDFFVYDDRARSAPVRVLTPEEVLDTDGYSLPGIVAVISAALSTQLGSKRIERTEQVEREAATLEGIAQALRIGGVR